jgi:hypothetical protein
MSERYDSSKGRYVRYDYEPKGDRFSRGLSKIPRVITTTTRTATTGHRFTRRTRTTEALELTIGRLLAFLGPEGKEKLSQETFYFKLANGKLQLRGEPPGILVRFTSTRQRLGKRWWFICAYCARRVGKLYFVKVKDGEVMGCQKCFGLSYPSQYQHRCPRRDEAIVGRKVKVSTKAFLDAKIREYRRLEKLYASVLRLLARAGSKR